MHTGTETKMKFRYAPSLFQRQEELKSLAQMEQSCQMTLAPKCEIGGTVDIPHHSLFKGLSVDLHVLCVHVWQGEGRRVEELNNCR